MKAVLNTETSKKCSFTHEGEAIKCILPAYMPELDGLRALAVLAVIFFHLHLPYCSLGWGGVYLFFVLSGFLITGILLETKENKHYLRTFYIRRTLRIFPSITSMLTSMLYYMTISNVMLIYS